MMQRWLSLPKLLVILLQVISGLAFQSIGSIRSYKIEVPRYPFPRFSNDANHPSLSKTVLWATLVIAEDPSVSLGLSVVNGANGKRASNGNGTPPFLHPSVTWLSSFSSADTVSMPPLSSFETVHALLQGKEDAESLIDSLPKLTSLNCLGIHVVLGGGGASSSTDAVSRKVAPETAQRVGALLQEILDATKIDTRTIVISLGMPVHLAMLQANCLPKTRTSNRRLFHVLQQTKEGNCKSILGEYLYNWDNPFGGTDPLACPSREVCSTLDGSPDAAIVSGALTSLLGLGLEPLDAVRDAQIVASSVHDQPSTDFVWEEGVQRFLASYSSYKVQVWNDDGVLRKEYIEFGYK